MEKLLDVLVNAPVISITASIIAVITALMENHGNGNSTRHNIVIAILAFSIAGIIVEYLPEQNIFISTFIGLMSGMVVDDLFDKALRVLKAYGPKATRERKPKEAEEATAQQ